MSLDKFVMKGFTGSLGSGEGRWVSSSQPYSGPSQQQTVVSHQGGTSFVMGGGALKGKPEVKQTQRREYPEASYRSDYRESRDKGSSRGRDSSNYDRSLVGMANTKEGHRVVMALVMYGIFLVIGIGFLIVYFGSANNNKFYSAPIGFSRDTQARWGR